MLWASYIEEETLRSKDPAICFGLYLYASSHIYVQNKKNLHIQVAESEAVEG